MAEHDSEREGREERDGLGPEEQNVPFDEAAAWAAIVAGYGDEPPDPPGAKPFKSVEDLARLEGATNGGTGTDTGDRADAGTRGRTGDKRSDQAGGATGEGADGGSGSEEEGGPPRREAPRAGAPKPLGGSVSFAPGVGPRDYSVAEPSDDDLGEDEEGHFVPPEPPPLPAADTTAKFAWLAVLGGPVLLLLAVLLGWDMTWWLATLGIGGFLGGFATLVTRMRTDEDDGDDPGRGAVV